MKIAIDCRYLGMSGIGRYIEGILYDLDFSNNEYLFIGNEEKIKNYNTSGEIIADNSNPFSLRGLFIDRSIVKRINSCDAYFTPNFIIPYGIKVPVFSTIHDVIFMDMRKETTRGFIDYAEKKYLLKRCMRKSKIVFTVSHFSAERINSYFSRYSNKICVIYNGVPFSAERYKNTHVTPISKGNYMIYCGNIKKHKGLAVLLEAFEILRNNGNDIELKIVGEAKKHRISDTSVMKRFEMPGISFTGSVNDEELYGLIAGAKFLVQPSFYEGFGLPPLEALCLGTKPIISDIDVFKEIYSDMDVCFFKTGDSKDLAEKITVTSSRCKGSVDEKFDRKRTVGVLLKTIELNL